MPIQTVPDAFSLNYCMDYIYSCLGGLARNVEVKGLDMATIIARRTIPEYSKFFPQEEVIVLKRKDQVKDREGFYYIKSKNPIMSVARAIGLMDTRATVGTLAGYNAGRNLSTIDVLQTMCSVTGSASVSQVLIDEMNLNNYSAASMLPITTRFHPPNIIELFPKQNYEGAGIVLHTMHPITLETIGWNMADEFMDLAKCDYFIAMKAIFKKYEKIQSIYGEINLDMEDFNNAVNERKEILEKWRKFSPLRANNKRWYIA